MAEIIQFPCPACGTPLRLPLTMAASRGPCPHCDAEIIAPDPYQGIGARLAPIPVLPPPEPPPTFRPFVESPPIVQPERRPFKPTAALLATPPHFEAALEPKDDFVAPFSSPPPSPDPTPKPQPIPQPSPQPALQRDLQPAPSAPLIQPPPSPQPLPGCIAPPMQRLILSCALTAVVCFAAGFIFGTRAPHFPLVSLNDPPAPVTHKTPQNPITPAEPKPAPVPDPIPVIPPLNTSPPPKPNPDPTPPPPAPTPPTTEESATAVAEATLKAFLDAPDWSSRASHVLYPETVRPLMEAHAATGNDGPTPFQSIDRKHSSIIEETGDRLFIFEVVTDSIPDGIPVAVMETKQGWRVDWLWFIEFRDNLFKKFTEGPVDQPATHRLIVGTATATEGEVENEFFASYDIEPPVGGTRRQAYVKKDSKAHEALKQATASGRYCAPTLEVVKRSAPDGRTYLEILRVIAGNWGPIPP